MRFFNFTLIALLVGQIVMGSLMIAVAKKDDPTRVEIPDEKAVAKWLIELTGRVKVEYPIDNGRRVDSFAKVELLPSVPYKIYEVDFRRTRNAGVPELKRLATIPYIRVLWLDNTRANDAGLAHLGKMMGLRHLSLHRCNVTDVGLKELRHLHLRSIGLAATRITDAGVAHLKNMEDITQLRLDDTSITDTGLANISGLKRMYNLDLDNTRITDKGLRHLGAMSNLHFLDIGSPNITDAGMKHLTGFKKLESLSLANASITEVGLRELAEMPALKTLILSGSQLSPAMLDQLATTDGLTRIDLYDCGVTFEEASRLKRALPKCLVQGVPTRP